MSLGRMLTKVAIGFAVAKGMQAVTKGGGIGKVMDGLKGGDTAARGDGLPGSRQAQTGGAHPGGAQTGGLGGMLESLTGAGGGAGGLGGLVSGMGGGSAGAGGGMGGLGGLGGLLGGLATARGGTPEQGQSLEDLLSRDMPKEEPEEEATAGLMIRAMVMAARCDGEIDGNERDTLMATIGEDATPEDMAFVRAAMDEQVNPRKLAEDTPQGLETQVYSMAVMAIEPDHPEEAKFLHELATAQGIGQATVNEIHDSFGVQRLYR